MKQISSKEFLKESKKQKLPTAHVKSSIMNGDQ